MYKREKFHQLEHDEECDVSVRIFLTSISPKKVCREVSHLCMSYALVPDGEGGGGVVQSLLPTSL